MRTAGWLPGRLAGGGVRLCGLLPACTQHVLFCMHDQVICMCGYHLCMQKSFYISLHEHASLHQEFKLHKRSAWNDMQNMTLQ